MVKKPHYTIVEGNTDEPTVDSPQHPHYDLIVKMRAAATTFEIGRRVMLAEEKVGPNIWSIFRRLSTDDASEEQLVALMDMEIHGLGQVAKVFGTHQGTEGREENIWEILDFFLHVHIGLSQSPRKAWRDKKHHSNVLRLAKIYGCSIGSI